MKILIESLKTQNGKVTEFYKGSRFFGGKYTSSGHEYWTSNSEMFARAFHCYLEDKVAEMNKKDGKEGRNDYLCGHASGYVTTGLDGTYYRAFPIGEERKIINQNFDNLFEKLRDKGLIHQWTPEMEKKYIQPNVLDYIKESQKTEIEKAFSQNNSNTKIETKPILKNSLAGENPEGIKKFLNRANKEQTKYVNIASKLLSNNDDASLMFDFSDDVHLGRLTSKLVEYKDTEFVKKLSDVVYEDDLLKLKNIVPDNEVLREYVDATIETLEKRRKNDVDIVSGANGQQTLNFDTTTNNKAISNQDSLNNQNNQNIQNNQENVRYSSTKRKDGNDQIQFDI
jgi:major membrane immunogen (membrane-anchored lipoprotein)